MSASIIDPDLKSTRLRNYFFAIIGAKRAIKNTKDAGLFLEAICNQVDRLACIEKLVASPQGLQALKMSLQSDVSNAFMNCSSTMFLNYIADDGVRQLCGGQLLRDILVAIVEPPLFWNALKKAYEDKALSISAVQAFACLLLELLTVLPPSSSSSVQLNVISVAESALATGGGLLDTANADTRSIAYKIQDAVRSRARPQGGKADGTIKAGGRHDNDFEDFRQIAIFPTADEFLAKEPPFYLQAEAVLDTPPANRVAVHLDNQFRLLREDMIAELRGDLLVVRDGKQGKRPVLRLRGLAFTDIDCGTDTRRKEASVALRCYQGLPKLDRMGKDQRKKYYAENKTLLKHQSFGCLLASGDIVGFATLDRDEDLLAEDTPIILLRVFGHSALKKTLVTLKAARPHELEFVLVDTPFFAYEPVLRCLQEMPSLPLSDQLMSLDGSVPIAVSSLALESLAARIKRNEGCNLRNILNLPKDVTLDSSQTESLVTGISQAVSLIQGPPGTGKSFLGAILAKILLENTDETLLVLCYTNHALDQFLEDILDIGVSQDYMLRLGSKSTARTKSLGLYEQSGNYRRSKQSWDRLNQYSDEVDRLATEVQRRASAFRRFKISDNDLLDYLQFSDGDFHFFHALTTPEQDGSMVTVDKKGKAIGPSYLIDRWQRGWDAGIFQDAVEMQDRHIWEMDQPTRISCYKRWTYEAFLEQVVMLQDLMDQHANIYARWSNSRQEKNAEVIRSKRIIGCTTTAAAKYMKELSNAKPGIVLVEEAGEILETHVLTALSSHTKHLILIGDHQQLRPKVNNFALTVERGDGYDLNKSLFERLVTSGYPHVTLAKQHRMRPEISALVKELMYPGLQDDAKVFNRPNLRGFQSNVIFFNHDHVEIQAQQLADRRDEGSKVSRQNLFEVEIVLKTVRYLAQQGYGTDKQVVLTPYLGQLGLLLKHLQAEHDPVLNDLDSFDLVRAGLLSPAGTGVAKRPLKISTIDNYQGEESEVVIVSLTRSNNKGDIGFMAAPQRLNVLLSRARDGLIIIGNASTFTRSQKGHGVWGPFLEQLGQAGQLYDGLPIRCERHSSRVALLKTKEDFDIECPDGGCSEPCGTILNCGKHTCPQRCHQLFDHSKVQCKRIMQEKCLQNHNVTWECWKQSAHCATCEMEARKREAQRQRDHKLDLQRQAQEQEYALKLAKLDDEIADQRRLQKEHIDRLDKEHVIEQRKNDLVQARAAATEVSNRKSQEVSTASTLVDRTRTASSPAGATPVSTLGKPSHTPGPDVVAGSVRAREEWDYQKAYENADNEHLDALMDMIGLESVKLQILAIKTKIDTCIRQGASLQDERFGAVLLGNPGTGKTTVARLYAKCLASMGVLAGATIKETTGARLAGDGMQAFKKLIEEVLNSGGGAIFIDEAYQLTSGSNPGGGQILDFLLGEVENLTGKIVFILAGYNKQMETFFAHNPGLPSRFPCEFQFNDYEDHELLCILGYRIKKRFKGRMKVEDGLEGLYCRIAARRVGYGRGRKGFGNARAIENMLAKILDRQATRLARERRAGKKPDDLLLAKEDLIGPEPLNVLEGNKSWRKLRDLIGLGAVKQSVNALFQSIRYNYERELDEKPLLQFNLNRVFLGSPGTGKTTVAKLYGQILADIGFLSNGEVVVKNPSDFVGDVLGASEKTTQGILASTVGKVLVIDEAYGLYGGSSSGGRSQSDPYKTAVIDTIVAEVQSVPGDDRCLLLLGYKDQMESMFQNANPGLSRRFPLSEAFNFEDFTDEELKEVLELKIKQQGYKATDQALGAAMDCLRRARNRPNFGNAGEVDNLLNSAKARHQQRRSTGNVKDAQTLEAVDMDPEFDRAERAVTNVRMLFEGVVGCDDLVRQLEGYQKTVANMKARGMDPREQIPFNFLFRGPPGTGKTTTARKMGKIYYDMGFLATAEVLETSSTDLVGQYVGQTGPKTQALLEKALGKVLFIDEAYRLAEGQFAKEAMDEIVDCLTKPAFAQRLVVILAGYDAEINRLMSINPGLTSRFPETIVFRSLNPQECLGLFTKLLKKKKKHLDVTALENLTAAFERDILVRFETLGSLANWANARDVGTLTKTVFGQLISTADPASSDPIRLDEVTVLTALDGLISERSKQARHQAGDPHSGLEFKMQTEAPQIRDEQPPPNIKTSSTRAQQQIDLSQEEPPVQDQAPDPAFGDARDSGVEDEVWACLQRDKQAASDHEKQYQDLLAHLAQTEEENARRHVEKTEEDERRQHERDSLSRSAEDTEAKRRLEEERVNRGLARRKREEELDRLQREKQKRELERRAEEAVQRKLRTMGLCVAGFRWIKQASGYRCAGGSHYVSNEHLGAG